MNAEFTELLGQLESLTKSFSNAQEYMCDLMEKIDDRDNKEYYNKVKDCIEDMKTHQCAFKEVIDSINDKVNEKYEDSDTKFKEDKKLLLKLQLKLAQLELNKLNAS